MLETLTDVECSMFDVMQHSNGSVDCRSEWMVDDRTMYFEFQAIETSVPIEILNDWMAVFDNEMQRMHVACCEAQDRLEKENFDRKIYWKRDNERSLLRFRSLEVRLNARNAATTFQSSKFFARLTLDSIKLKYSDDSANEENANDELLIDFAVDGICDWDW